MRAQREAAILLPVREVGPSGVISTIFMDHGHADRPTSGASAADLVAQLRETRLRTRRLTDDLSWPELMGPRLDIVNPVLWCPPSAHCDQRPDRFDQSKRPSPLNEAIDRCQDASASEGQNEPGTAMFQCIENQHGTDGEKSEKRQIIHRKNSLRDGRSGRSSIRRSLEDYARVSRSLPAVLARRGDSAWTTRQSAMRPPLQATSVARSSPRRRLSAAIFNSVVSR